MQQASMQWFIGAITQQYVCGVIQCMNAAVYTRQNSSCSHRAVTGQ